MNAKQIVTNLIEADEERPEDFIERQGADDMGERIALTPTHGFDFNIGEGKYRVGIAFTVRATSQEEAIYIANQYLNSVRNSSDPLSVSGCPASIVNRIDRLRVYVDDECVATWEDIVDAYPLE